MNKIMKLSLFTLVIFLSLVLVTACNKKESKTALIGSWEHDKYIYTFNEDKTCTYEANGKKMKCTYKVDGDKLSILYDGNTTPFETTYSIDKNKLNVKDSFGNDTIYNKK